MSPRWSDVALTVARPARYTGRHRATFCSWCDGPVLIPVRDAEAVSWVGAGASTYCSRACLENHAEHRINVSGNEPS